MSNHIRGNTFTRKWKYVNYPVVCSFCCCFCHNPPPHPPQTCDEILHTFNLDDDQDETLCTSAWSEPSSRKGIVLIGVNNPPLSLDEIKRDYVLCEDVSDSISWLSWKKTDISAGYSYACEVAEFRKRVDHLPQFSVSGLLL